jgi:hypothetical protein
MTEVNRDEMLAELSAGAVQWSQWRATRKVGTRIPEPLWELAVELARKYGVSRTAATLRVSYDALKKHCEVREVTASGKATARFVELPRAATDAVVAVGDCRIEFEKSSGARMRIRVAEARLSDLVAWSRSFWEAP